MLVYKSVLENENSGGLTVDSLQITSPATNTEFQISENFDTNGLVVTATIGRVVADVTIDCTFTPSIGTTFVDNDIGYQNVNIQYGGKTTSYRIRIKDRQAKIYGVQWNDTTSSRLARTDSASLLSDPIPAVNNGNGSSPFDTIYPWSEIKVIEDPDVGTLVSIPKYYYKWTNENEILSLQISEGEFEGSHVSPAHADRGDGVGERDVVYIGRYHCAKSTYKSSTRVKPYTNISRSSFREAIHNLGTDIWQNDYAMRWTVNMLYLVEYANWDIQSTIGMTGIAIGNTVNMGYTDSMVYHTGTSAVDRNTGGGMQYRHIEGWCDNCLDWCDGIYSSNYNIYIIMNPSRFSDSSNGVYVGKLDDANGGYGYIKTWIIPSSANYEWALIPVGNKNSRQVTPISDFMDTDSDRPNLSVGGYYYEDRQYGAFYMVFTRSYSSATNVGSRLMKLPNS